jgi:hypothetical protein
MPASLAIPLNAMESCQAAESQWVSGGVQVMDDEPSLGQKIDAGKDLTVEEIE